MSKSIYTEKTTQSSITKPCLFCGKPVTKRASEAKRFPNFFCCRSHAASYNNTLRQPRSKESRIKTSNSLQEYYQTHPKSKTLKSTKSVSQTKPLQTTKRKECKICGQYPCVHSNPCKGNWLRNKNNIKRLELMGFDTSSLGSLKVIDSYNSFREYILNLYMENEMSQIDLAKMFKFPCTSTLSLLFKWLQIPVLSKHDQGIRSITKIQKNKPFESNNYHYKHGFHITWFGTIVFYRSSYELDYCNQLDNQKIKYDMESMRIKYWDSVQQKERVAIPDFYLPESNTIIEIKSVFTYNKQNMIDRSIQYQNLGYKFKLILEHQEYDFCP